MPIKKADYKALLERIDALEPKKSIQYDQANEFYQWYIGDSTTLKEFYTGTNNANSFWKKASAKVKKVHSGISRSMIDILTIVTGIPEVTCEEDQERLDELIEENNFLDYLKSEIRPRTLATGHGAFFINYIDGNVVFDYIDARHCRITRVGGKILAMTKITCFEKYNLEETRSYNQIEYKLFDKKGNQVSLANERETANLYLEASKNGTLSGETVTQIINVDMIPAVALRYKAGGAYGASIYTGKLDMLDTLDEVLSRIATNARKHSVNTYIQAHLIDTDVYGNRILPDDFQNEIVVLKRDANQVSSSTSDGLKTEQAPITYDGLLMVKEDLIKDILAGVVSPSSLGFEFQRTPNAEAQREREKSTLFTRDDIIDNEISFVKKCMELALKFDDIMTKSSTKDYEINVDYSDYASPTFNERVQVLLPLYNSGAISEEKFVRQLWANVLSDEEVLEEVEKLKQLKQALPQDFNQLFSE